VRGNRSAAASVGPHVTRFALACVAIGLSGLAACGDADGAQSDGTSPVPTIPDWDDGEQAQFVGELRWDDQGCVLGVVTGPGSEDEIEVPLVFPFGYSQLDERRAIVNEDGQVVAEEGDSVELSGGYHPAVDGAVVGHPNITVRPCPDREEVFLVQHPIE
jgi:hypothetical protein